MSNTVFVKIYDEPKFNKKEILRYAQAKKEDDSLKTLIDECLKEIEGKLSYKICYSFFDIDFCNDILDLSFASTKSNDLKNNLKDCKKIIVFGATIGIEIDRLIAKYGKISPVKSLIFQAIGAERIESVCDIFNEEIKKDLSNENLFTRPRFSPGYGDFPLDFQRDIFNVLDCHKKIGLTLNDSLIMSPSKSVTAIIGISNKDNCKNLSNCKKCTQKNCSFRITN